LGERRVGGLALGLMASLHKVAGRVPNSRIFMALFDASLELLNSEELGEIPFGTPSCPNGALPVSREKLHLVGVMKGDNRLSFESAGRLRCPQGRSPGTRE
jgi:hypothetical protein